MHRPVRESKSAALVCDICSRIPVARPVVGHNGCMTDQDRQPVQGVRARARAELLADVSKIARSHLAASGAAALSVRAIARDLGLASSALYRYYPSRDALLTQLIVEAYSELGEAVEVAEAAVDRHNLAGRYTTICHAVRDWALANPHEYALIYGSPVAGYEAPQDTIDPAVRAARVVIRLAGDISPSARLVRGPGTMAPTLAEQLDGASRFAGVEADHDVLALAVGLWAQLFGFVSFELFGTFRNAFDPADALFDHQIRLAIRSFGLSGS